MGEQWTQKHLLETVMIATIGPAGWAALWKKGGELEHAGRHARAEPLQDAARLHELRRCVADVAGRVEARRRRQGRLQHHGRLAGRVLQRHRSRATCTKPRRGYNWAAVPGTNGVYDWLSDSFTLPKGAPHRAAAVQWLGFLGSRQAQDTFNPVKGSIPARQGREREAVRPYLKWALKQWKTDKLAGSLTHGVVATNAWNADIDTALGLFLADEGRGEVPVVARERPRSKNAT